MNGNIEESADFHHIRRILKNIAPQFRIITKDDLCPDEFVLDVQKKTIEISDLSDASLDTVTKVLFHMAHLRLKDDFKYSLFFGKGFDSWKGHEEDLIDMLAELGAEVDSKSAKWASSALQLFWGATEEQIEKLIAKYQWNKTEWFDYFTGTKSARLRVTLRHDTPY